MRMRALKCIIKVCFALTYLNLQREDENIMAMHANNKDIRFISL